MNKIITSEYALKAQTALWETGRSSRVVGWGDPPTGIYYQDGWSLEKILKSDLECTTHPEVLERINILEKGGIKYSHILIAHELPKPVKRLEIPKEILSTAHALLPVLGAILRAVGTTLVVSLRIIAAVIGFFVVNDPVVIVVIEPDKTWLEIAKWYD